MATSFLTSHQRQPAKHRAACVFGTGYWKIRLVMGLELTFVTYEQAEDARMRLPPSAIAGLSRDGYCLDPEDFPEVVDRPQAPLEAPVVDAEAWLGMPQPEQMRVLGLESSDDYERALRAVTEMVTMATNRESQNGVKISVVIKRKGQTVIDI